LNALQDKQTDWDATFIQSSPMFAPFKQFESWIGNLQCWPNQNDLNQLGARCNKILYTRSGKKISFTPMVKGKTHPEQKYEASIYLTGQVQTRGKNWHDFFNALVWHVFPLAKSVLNELHYHEQVAASVHNNPARGILRDAATLFDESGIIVMCSNPELVSLLRNFQWKQLFWDQRELVLSSMRLFVFGHGLYEKALHPYTGMTGKALIFDTREAFLETSITEQLSQIDRIVADFLSQEFSTGACLSPVPILGYPGWWKQSEREEYYDNKQYFRERTSKI